MPDSIKHVIVFSMSLFACKAMAMEPTKDEINVHPICNMHIHNPSADPDKIYTEILNSGNSSETLLIVDVDGTITNERDPNQLKPHQPATKRGESVENLRKLMTERASVIFCSAWYDINAVIKRLEQVGFTEKDLGIIYNEHFDRLDKLQQGRKYYQISESQAKSFLYDTLRDEPFGHSSEDEPYSSSSLSHEESIQEEKTDQPASKSDKYQLTFMRSGNVISVRCEEYMNTNYPLYYRNKAFSSMFLAPERLQDIKYIYFLDDSLTNHTYFRNDVEKFGLYSDKKINLYLISEE